MKKELNYPIIVLSRTDNGIYVFFDKKDFTSTSEYLFKQTDYTSFDIIDRFGNKHKIKKASKVGYNGLWGFSLLLKGRQIVVEFDFDSEFCPILIDKIKEQLIVRVQKNKSLWSAAWDIKQLELKIQQSQDVSELANLLK